MGGGQGGWAVRVGGGQCRSAVGSVGWQWAVWEGGGQKALLVGDEQQTHGATLQSKEQELFGYHVSSLTGTGAAGARRQQSHRHRRCWGKVSAVSQAPALLGHGVSSLTGSGTAGAQRLRSGI